MPRLLPFALLQVFGLLACDGAKSDFERCADLKARRQLLAAERACAAAVKSEASSPYGKRAAAKLLSIKAARAREAKKAADARAERARLLGGEPSIWQPASEQQLADWRLLVDKHPKSTEASVAARRLQRLTSVCRHYVAGSLYGFFELTSELDKLALSTQRRFNTWHFSEGGESLLAAADSARARLDEQQGKLSVLCDGIGAHPERPGEAPIKRSLVKDCARIKAYAASLYEMLNFADGVEVLAINYMITWPELEERRAVLGQTLEANEAKRADVCKALPRSTTTQQVELQKDGACGDKGACPADKDATGPLAVTVPNAEARRDPAFAGQP